MIRFLADDLASIGECVEDILLVAECSEQSEWRDQVNYLPLMSPSSGG